MPRLAVFGIDLSVNTPLTVSAWSRRFMMVGDQDDEQVEVYYRPPNAAIGVTHVVDVRIAELVRFLGRTTTPDKPLPGLGFSYSEVVGVLHQIWRQGYLEADFRPEQDRILAAILRQQRRGMVTERPEFGDSDLGGPDSPVADELQRSPQRPAFLEPGTALVRVAFDFLGSQLGGRHQGDLAKSPISHQPTM